MGALKSKKINVSQRFTQIFSGSSFIRKEINGENPMPRQFTKDIVRMIFKIKVMGYRCFYFVVNMTIY